MSSFRRIFVSFLFAVICCSANGQLSTGGNEPSSIRWYSISSPAYRVIYPQDCDCLATLYLQELERCRPLVSASLQMAPGQYHKRPLDVILHTRNANSNGRVTWTPDRMELYTVPQWDSPLFLSWHKQLVIHEARHAAQMQMGYKHVFKPFYYILGQMTPGAACAWPDHLLLEGDAVVAETALTNSGRGRSADFLSYYMYCLDNGDRRNWMRWRMGSHYKYTPNVYAFGYLMISGARAFYETPLFMADYMDYVSRRPYDPWPLRHTLRRTTGLKFRRSVSAIMDGHYRVWYENLEQRDLLTKPFADVNIPRYLTSYRAIKALSKDSYIWIKDDIYHPLTLEMTDTSGKRSRMLYLSPSVANVNVSSDGTLFYWNELRSDPRWDEQCHSVVRTYDGKTKKRNTLHLKKGNHICPVQYSGDTLAVISYLEKGGFGIDFHNAVTSECYGHWDIPDTLQPVQLAVLGGEIYFSAISDSGSSLWKTDGRKLTSLLKPSPVSITSLAAMGECINFISDKDGSSQVYSYYTTSGVLSQRTTTKYGVIGAAVSQGGDIMYSEYGPNGTMLRLSIYNEPFPVMWGENYSNPIADKLSAQEKALPANSDRQMRMYHWAKKGREWGLAEADSTDTPLAPADSVKGPERYVKGANAFRFHSWAPCYVDIDNILSLSYENVKNIASLGAMGLFQNSMSTIYGYVGYKAAPDQTGRWFHSGHLSLTYSGLYPVFEAKLHIGEGKAVDYFHNEKRDTLFYRNSTRPSVRASLKTYVPLSWNRGAMFYGLIPSAAVTYTNNTYDSAHTFLFNVGVRAYAMQSTPSAAIYPRWGIGAELQWAHPALYGYLYGYVPGICRGQGLKLTALAQRVNGKYEGFVGSYANLFPRGYAKYSGSRLCEGLKFTADYAIPFYMGDWHIFDMFYCTRGIVTPHFDYGLVGEFASSLGSLWSAGATFEMEFAAFFWVKTPVTVGVTYSYNGGSLLSATGILSPHYVGATFNIDLPN